MLAEAQDVQAAILRLADLVAEVDGQVSGTVTIGLARQLVSPIFDKVEARFYADHPAATVDLDVLASRAVLAPVAARRAGVEKAQANACPPSLHFVKARSVLRPSSSAVWPP